MSYDIFLNSSGNRHSNSEGLLLNHCILYNSSFLHRIKPHKDGVYRHLLQRVDEGPDLCNG